MKTLKNQSGFSHTAIALIICVMVIIGLVGWRVVTSSKNTPNNQATSQTPEESDVQLQNLGLASLDSVLVSQDALREYDSSGLKGFYVFGDKLSGGRINPNFEFASLKEDTEIISAIDGVVTFIREQPDSDDSEVMVQPKDGSAWTLGYDHLTDLVVKKGDRVKAGDVLGRPARQNNGSLRFELQINKDLGGQTTHYCPSLLLAPAVKDAVLAQLAAMQTSWNNVSGKSLYDLSAQNPTGCIVQTLSPTQAEGR